MFDYLTLLAHINKIVLYSFTLAKLSPHILKLASLVCDLHHGIYIYIYIKAIRYNID